MMGNHCNEDSIGFDITWKNGTKGIWRFNYEQEVDVLNLNTTSPTRDRKRLVNVFFQTSIEEVLEQTRITVVVFWCDDN
jgi:hypothetical protein